MPVRTALAPYVGEFIALLTYLAVIACALSGVFEARRRQMDVVGAVSVAFLTAFGGGTLRDMLLGRTPVFWLLDRWLTVAAFVTAAVAYYSVRRVSDRLLLVADALGLGMFSVLGATYALQMGLSMLVAVLMGVVTGIFGGVLRDMVCNRVPAVFRRNTELYATCAFVGSWVFVILVRVLDNPRLASTIGAAVVILLRLISVRYRLTLPEPQTAAETPDDAADM